MDFTKGFDGKTIRLVQYMYHHSLYPVYCLRKGAIALKIFCIMNQISEKVTPIC